MTHHYTIELHKPNVELKATYKNKKFVRIERTKGVITRELMDSIGKTIPINEEEISKLNEKLFQRVTYSIIPSDKQPSLYILFLNEWIVFYERITNLSPKITGADGNALKQIIQYLKKINGNNEEIALDNWKVILASWGDLPKFHQDNTDLKYINSKLNVIIRLIIRNNGSDTTGNNSSVSL